jgi:large subunit ribosomal protein L6
MSKIGKKPIEIPKEVSVEFKDDEIFIKGPKGELKKKIPSEINAELKEGKIFLSPKFEAKKVKALWGLTRSLISNWIKGVSQGFEKKLEIQGIGYRAELKGESLFLYVGFSKPVEFKIPKGIKISLENNIITVSGIDKELVGQTAANIRKIKEPDPYKGKGIRYLGEKIKLKPGKKVAAAK